MRLPRFLLLLPFLFLGGHAFAAPSKSAWRKVCGEDGCAVQQEIIAKPKTLMLRVSLRPDKEPDQARIHLGAPMGVFLGKGISLSVDGSVPIRLGYRRCLGDECVALAVLNFEALSKFLQGKVLTVHYAVSEQQDLDIPVKLDGLDTALQSLGK